MRNIHLAKSFAQALAASKQEPQPQQPNPDIEQCRQLLQLIRLYRQYEEAWFEKIKRKEFAVNEKNRMMESRRKLDYFISTITL